MRRRRSSCMSARPAPRSTKTSRFSTYVSDVNTDNIDAGICDRGPPRNIYSPRCQTATGRPGHGGDRRRNPGWIETHYWHLAPVPTHQGRMRGSSQCLLSYKTMAGHSLLRLFIKVFREYRSPDQAAYLRWQSLRLSALAVAAEAPRRPGPDRRALTVPSSPRQMEALHTKWRARWHNRTASSRDGSRSSWPVHKRTTSLRTRT